MTNLSDIEIKKALACCKELHFQDCACCPLDKRKDCIETLAKYSLNLINRKDAEIDELKKENSELFYTLLGVMHSVDKWLEGDELEQDEVNRAVTMREKTLRIVEQAKFEAIKEFADRLITERLAVITLKGKSNDFAEGFQSALEYVEEQSNNLLKEMEKKINENA